MNILIVQLARFGDIYMTWPVARALQRKFPNAKLHYLVREKFSSALLGLEVVFKTHLFKTEEIIRHTLESVPIAQEHLTKELREIKRQKFDLIVNLTFSPVSSFITYFLTEGQSLGYTRYWDSSFAIKEALSGYYYSEVGISKSNRFHLIDLFASLCDVDLKEEDFLYPIGFPLASPIDDAYLTIQVGASQKNKTLPPFLWSRIIKKLLSYDLGYKIVLIGSKSEEDLGKEITLLNTQSQIINLIGKTEIEEIFPILKNSALHIGPDSVFIHMCNLTQTPCFNLSFDSVKFWETGPRAKDSHVYLSTKSENVESTDVAESIRSVLLRKPLPRLISIGTGLPFYQINFDLYNDFEWNLVKSIYLDYPFPVTSNGVFVVAIRQLNNINDAYLDILEKCRTQGCKNYLNILDSLDESFKGIAKMSKSAAIYTDWCLVEKIKVPPLTEIKIVESYLSIHTSLKLLLRPYIMDDSKHQEEEKNHG